MVCASCSAQSDSISHRHLHHIGFAVVQVDSLWMLPLEQVREPCHPLVIHHFCCSLVCLLRASLELSGKY